MQQLKDADLVKRAQKGDSEAVGVLFDRHHLRIYRYVRARIFNTQTAHDVTGEVFLRVVSHIHTYRPMGVPFTAWLYQITRNYLADFVQKENRLETVPMAEAAYASHTAVNPVAVVEQKIESESLLEALTELDETHRDVLILRFLVGLSLKETAETMDKTVAAIKSIQYRGLKMMKVLVKDRG